MKITVNGTDRSVREGETLQSLVTDEGHSPGHVFVRHNGQMPERRSWPQLDLEPGDTVEIIKIISGG